MESTPAKDFILNEKTLNRTEIALLIYGGEKATARAYLEKKLTGKRIWSAADESRAIEVLKELGERIGEVTLKS